MNRLHHRWHSIYLKKFKTRHRSLATMENPNLVNQAEPTNRLQRGWTCLPIWIHWRIQRVWKRKFPDLLIIHQPLRQEKAPNILIILLLFLSDSVFIMFIIIAVHLCASYGDEIRDERI